MFKTSTSNPSEHDLEVRIDATSALHHAKAKALTSVVMDEMLRIQDSKARQGVARADEEWESLWS